MDVTRSRWRTLTEPPFGACIGFWALVGPGVQIGLICRAVITRAGPPRASGGAAPRSVAERVEPGAHLAVVAEVRTPGMAGLGPALRPAVAGMADGAIRRRPASMFSLSCSACAPRRSQAVQYDPQAGLHRQA